MRNTKIDHWHDIMLAGNLAALDDILADDIIFISPVVHTPQRGKQIAILYLTAAYHVLGGTHFRYVREFDCGARAVLEFESAIDDILINGVDMIEWNTEEKISSFKVMVRPLKAIEAVHSAMGRIISNYSAKS